MRYRETISAIPPYCALWGFWCLNMANWVRYPLPLFWAFPLWRACEVEMRYPPPPKTGYLSDTGAIPCENKANGCDTPLCDTISRGYCAIGGVSRTGPLWIQLQMPTWTVWSRYATISQCMVKFWSFWGSDLFTRLLCRLLVDDWSSSLEFQRNRPNRRCTKQRAHIRPSVLKEGEETAEETEHRHTKKPKEGHKNANRGPRKRQGETLRSTKQNCHKSKVASPPAPYNIQKYTKPQICPKFAPTYICQIFVDKLKNDSFRTNFSIFDKFLTNVGPLTGTPKNNHRRKSWTNLGFGILLNAVRGRRVRKSKAAIVLRGVYSLCDLW